MLNHLGTGLTNESNFRKLEVLLLKVYITEFSMIIKLMPMKHG